jgi:Glycosyltransferases, probably involved in cell wall biogenesis
MSGPVETSHAYVSVIVPAYNAARTIAECLDSILAVRYPSENFELIVVDNASTDQTGAILRSYDQKIKTFQELKRGPAAARNKGLQNASGKIIAFTDADCVVEKDWLQNLIVPLEDSSIGAVGGRILSKQPRNPIEKFGEEIHDHSKAIEIYRPPYVITMNWASRLPLLKELNFFDEDLLRCEDVDLSYRIFQNGFRFSFRPDAIVYHRNENNYLGLSHEGFLHGYYSIPVLKRHESFLKQFGHRRWNNRTYVDIAHNLVDSITGKERDHSLCSFVFNSAKKIGKLFGSIRFAHVDL